MTVGEECRARTGNVEHASGKGRGDENFPVGSWLIAPAYRAHVHAYYRFARNADDVADASDLSPQEKLRRLDRMATALDGQPADDAPAACAMRESLLRTGIDPAHCHDLLDAFRMDATKTRYADWGELMGYCRLSAAPVGRYLLDLHGESRDTWPASDALCAALQVINHLQDCAGDYHSLDRVYIPQDWMAADGCGVADLDGGACSPGLARTLARAVRATEDLVVRARALPPMVRDRGLRAESAVIVRLAEKLTDRLKREDPLAGRVKLHMNDVVLAVASGVVGSWFRGGR